MQNLQTTAAIVIEPLSLTIYNATSDLNNPLKCWKSHREKMYSAVEATMARVNEA